MLFIIALKKRLLKNFLIYQINFYQKNTHNYKNNIDFIYCKIYL